MTGDCALVCLPCQDDLPILAQSCRQCGQFLTSLAEYCGKCLVNPPPFSRLYALFPYEPPLIQLILRLKFQGDLKAARWFGQRLAVCAEVLWQDEAKPDLILPVPLHAKRLRERGFNQALEIAKPFAKASGIPLDRTGVKRHKFTLPQQQLTAKARQQNVTKAFSTGRSYQNLHIAILDDVVTTTQTVTDLSQTLLSAGASRIDVFCIARV